MACRARKPSHSLRLARPSLSQTFFSDRLGFDIGYHEETFNDDSYNPGSDTIYADVHSRWIDGTNTYSTGFNGAGTVTFTVLQIGRIVGSFNVTLKTLGAPSAVQTLTLVGTFDLKFP